MSVHQRLGSHAVAEVWAWTNSGVHYEVSGISRGLPHVWRSLGMATHILLSLGQESALVAHKQPRRRWVKHVQL